LKLRWRTGRRRLQPVEKAESRSRPITAGEKSTAACRWDQARRLKELEQENAKLKRLVAALSLDKLVLKDIASGNF
jgi:hypothetical protein